MTALGYRGYRNDMISLGRSFLYKVLNQESYEKRRDLVADNIFTFHDSWTELLFLADGSERPLVYPADKYDVDNIEDALPTLPPIEQPNYAWVKYWFGEEPIGDVRLDEMYEAEVGSRLGWEWGYAWWDRERLIEWQVPRFI